MLHGVGTTTNLMLHNIPEEWIPQMVYPFLLVFKLHITVRSLSTSRIEIKVLKCSLQINKCRSSVSERTWIAEANRLVRTSSVWFFNFWTYNWMLFKCEQKKSSLHIYKSVKPNRRQTQAVIFIRTFLVHYSLYTWMCDITSHGYNFEVTRPNYQYLRKCYICNICPVGSLECLTLGMF